MSVSPECIPDTRKGRNTSASRPSPGYMELFTPEGGWYLPISGLKARERFLAAAGSGESRSSIAKAGLHGRKRETKARKPKKTTSARERKVFRKKYWKRRITAAATKTMANRVNSPIQPIPV